MNYEQMGIAAMIPGMQHMIDLMQRELDAMRAQLAQAQNGGSALDAVRKYKRGMPLWVEEEFARKSKATGGWWAKLTPEERSAEMKRRYASRKDRPPTGRRRKDPTGIPSGPGGDHYGKVSTGQASYWAKMTKEERKAEMQRRTEVRNKKWAEAANVEKLHPRDPRSPKHEAWLKKMSKSMKKSWNKMTPAQQLQRQNAMRVSRGLAPKQHVNGEAAA